MEQYSLTITRIFDSPVEKLFKAWTSSEELKKWHHPVGMSVPDCEVEPQKFGKYLIAMKGQDEKTSVVQGVYQEFIPNKKLVFSWAWNDNFTGDGETLVTVEFKPINPTRTELVLTHERFLSEQSKQRHGQGWEGTFDNLQNIFKP